MSNNKVFFDIDEAFSHYDNSEVVILSVPFERSTSYVKGTSKGPSAVLDASTQVELYDIETDSEPYKKGIYTAEPLVFDDSVDPELSMEIIEKRARKLLEDGKLPVFIGGEHTLTLGAFRAFHNKSADITCLSLDAHADLRESYLGDRYSHACVMRRISEFKKPVLLGVRSIDKSEVEYTREKKIPLLFSDQIVQDPSCIETVFRELPERVYLSVDMDVFDPSFVPGVGNPEPGGLDWNQILFIIKELTENSKIIGVDVVEISPIEGQVQSEYTAAKLVYKILAYIFRQG